MAGENDELSQEILFTVVRELPKLRDDSKFARRKYKKRNTRHRSKYWLGEFEGLYATHASKCKKRISDDSQMKCDLFL